MSENVEAVYRENAALRARVAALEAERERLRRLVERLIKIANDADAERDLAYDTVAALASTPEPEGEGT